MSAELDIRVAHPNLALRRARLRAHLSQDDLARLIREAGYRDGDTNSCTRGMVQRWESGRVKRPQERYLYALESVLGVPADDLGFADEIVGIDRGRALARAGLDAPLPKVDPDANHGPLTGIWLSEYEYPSSSRGTTESSRHYVRVIQAGARVQVWSLPGQHSRLYMDMEVDGQVCTGTWVERTALGGFYRGAVYAGALQMLADPTGHRLGGKWVGFGKDREVNVGPWTLELVEDSVSEDAQARWSREPAGR